MTYQIVDTKGQSVTVCIPTQTMLVLLNLCVTVHLGTQPAGLTRPSPAGSRHHILADLPHQEFVSRGASYKRTIGCEGQGQNRIVVVNCHFEFRFVIREPGIPYGNYAVLTAGCQKSFTVRTRTLLWLPLQDRDSAIVSGSIIGTGKPFS